MNIHHNSEAKPETTTSTALAYLTLLADRGIEYIFANAGTDFAPIVEAYSQAGAAGTKLPTPIIATHENLGMAMAHGYAHLSGKMAAVMVHVSVGTANGICAVINASRENAPILFTAGRTPLYEDDTLGSRDSAIHWGQEMYDQAGMLREVVKWDYELRSGRQVATVIDRAINVAMTAPKGPVYLSLPREVLAEPVPVSVMKEKKRVAALPARPDAAGIAQVAKMLIEATSPLILAGNVGHDFEAVPALADFALRYGVPVVQNRSRCMSMPANSPMHVGFEAGPYFKDADLVIVLDCDVPWVVKGARPRDDANVVHVGVDPMYLHIPIRGFASDLVLTAAPRAFLEDLGQAVEGKIGKAIIDDRVAAADAAREAITKRRAGIIDKARDMRPIHPGWVSHCIARIKDDDTIIISEYTLNAEFCPFNKPGTYFSSSTAGGLGWGMGAALGAKLAKPDRLCIAVLGDGSYIFANPVAAHYASSENNLPILTVIVNNAMWNAVRRATAVVYPEGAAVKSNSLVMAELKGLPAFEQVCESTGGYGERVEDPAELPAALERALKAVSEGRQALLNVICRVPGM